MHPPPLTVEQHADGVDGGSTTFGVMGIKRQQGRANHMHPGSSPGHPLAGFVHMHDLSLLQGGADGLLHRFQAGVSAGLGAGQRAFRRLDPKQVAQGFDRALTGEQLVGLQVDRHRQGARPVLHRLRHFGRKGPGRHGLAGRAGFVQRLMFGHFWLRLGDLNHLPSLALHFHSRFQAHATTAADARYMRHDYIRIVNQHPRDTRMPGLAAALLAAAFAQAAFLGPLGRPIAGGWLVAVVAILVQSRFQFPHAGRQGLNLLGQRMHLLGQFRLGDQQVLDQTNNCLRAGGISGQDVFTAQHDG